MTHFRYTLVLLLLTLMVGSVKAQNRLDKLIGSYSTVGTSTYTSAVERNPRTRAVERVVKVLDTRSPNVAKTLLHAFRAEAKTHGLDSDLCKAKVRTQIFTQKGKEKTRLYMIEYPEGHAASWVRLTIIVKLN